MKRCISSFLIFVLLLTTLLTNITYADNGFDKKLEQSIIKVKDIFDISDKYDKFDSEVGSYEKETYFYLNWTSSKENLGSIHITVDSEGNILNYDKYTPYEEPKSKIAKLSYEDGKDLALEFIKKADSKLENQIQYKENTEPLNLNNTDYSYNFIRVINGITYPDNNISIYIDKYTGEVRNYYANWDRNIKIPDKSGIIDEEKAKELFKENIGLKLTYRSNYDGRETKYYLAYTVLDQNRGIDAKTGEIINIGYYGRFDTGMGSIEDNAVSKEHLDLTPMEKEKVDNLSGIISAEEAEKKARQVLDIDDNFKITNSRFHSQRKNNEDYTWLLAFTKSLEDEIEQHLEVSIDAKTEELISFYKDNIQNGKEKPKLNKKDSEKIARDFIEKVNPNKFKKIEYLPDNSRRDMESNYYFTYIRKKDDAYVQNDSISLNIDGITGEVVSYNMDWYKGELPTFEDGISLDRAYEVLFNEIGMELKYVSIMDWEREENKEVRLSYTIKTNKPLIIGNKTGEILNYDGNPYKENRVIEYKDIEKSYAKEKIKTLAQYGVFFETEQFKPKDKIKQKDFLYLLLKSLYPYDTIDEGSIEDKGYDRLVTAGIVKSDEKEPERIVTKEEGTKFIIRAMKYEKIAEINGIYRDIFKDQDKIDSKLKGYMSLGYGLKIIQGDDGYIKPKYELRREDGANIIYNYLFNE